MAIFRRGLRSRAEPLPFPAETFTKMSEALRNGEAREGLQAYKDEMRGEINTLREPLLAEAEEKAPKLKSAKKSLWDARSAIFSYVSPLLLLGGSWAIAAAGINWQNSNRIAYSAQFASNKKALEKTIVSDINSSINAGKTNFEKDLVSTFVDSVANSDNDINIVVSGNTAWTITNQGIFGSTSGTWTILNNASHGKLNLLSKEYSGRTSPESIALYLTAFSFGGGIGTLLGGWGFTYSIRNLEFRKLRFEEFRQSKQNRDALQEEMDSVNGKLEELRRKEEALDRGSSPARGGRIRKAFASMRRNR